MVYGTLEPTWDTMGRRCLDTVRFARAASWATLLACSRSPGPSRPLTPVSGPSVGSVAGAGGAGEPGQHPWPDAGPLTPVLRVVDLVAAGDQACVWLVDSRVACWLLNGASRAYDENLERTSSGPPPVAYEVHGLPPGRVIGLGVCWTHGCAVTEGGAVGCWTYDPSVEHDAPGPRPAVPIEVHDVTSVSLSPRVATAIRHDGSAWSWGLPWGQWFGDPTLQMAFGHHPDLAHPAPLAALHDVKQIAMNSDHACALLTDGSVECWGDNDYGGMGAREPFRAKVPVRVGGLERTLAVGLGWYGSCALVEGGQVWCWGVLLQAARYARACSIRNPMPEWINHSVPAHCSTQPVAIPGAERAIALSTDLFLAGILDEQSQGWWWGGSYHPAEQAPPTRIPGATLRKLAVHDRGVCTLDANDVVVCYEMEGNELGPPQVVRIPN
jgi:hypothetical protein